MVILSLASDFILNERSIYIQHLVPYFQVVLVGKFFLDAQELVQARVAYNALLKQAISSYGNKSITYYL